MFVSVVCPKKLNDMKKAEGTGFTSGEIQVLLKTFSNTV